MLVTFNTVTAFILYFIRTFITYIAQLITILLSGAGDGDDNKGKYRLFIRL